MCTVNVVCIVTFKLRYLFSHRADAVFDGHALRDVKRCSQRQRRRQRRVLDRRRIARRVLDESSGRRERRVLDDRRIARRLRIECRRLLRRLLY